MQNNIKVVNANKGFSCCDLNIPGELFGYLVSYLSLRDIIGKVALINHSFYQGVHGNQGLFSRLSQPWEANVEIEANKILEKIKVIKDTERFFLAKGIDIKEYLVEGKLIRQSLLRIIFNLLLDRSIFHTCNEHSILTCFFTKRIASSVFCKLNRAKWITPISLALSFNVLQSTIEPIKIKLNYISFWLDVWHDLPPTKVRMPVVKAFLLLFLSDSKIKTGDFEGHFQESDMWAQTPECVNAEQLPSLKNAAWEILKTCCTDRNAIIRSNVAIAAGLICLSNQDISIPWKEDALTALSLLALDRNIDVREQVANSITLIHKQTESLSGRLLENNKMVFREMLINVPNVTESACDHKTMEKKGYEIDICTNDIVNLKKESPNIKNRKPNSLKHIDKRFGTIFLRNPNK